MKRRTFLPVLLGLQFAATGLAFAQGDGDENARRQAQEAAERANRARAHRPQPAQVQPAPGQPPRAAELRRGEFDHRNGNVAPHVDRRGDPRYVQEAPRDYRRDGRPDWNHDGQRNVYRDDRGHWNAQTRHDWRGAGPGYRFYRGDRLPYEYRQRRYVVNDWRYYQLYAPPPGYYWVESDGDFLLVAAATGLILQILLAN